MPVHSVRADRDFDRATGARNTCRSNPHPIRGSHLRSPWGKSPAASPAIPELLPPPARHAPLAPAFTRRAQLRVVYGAGIAHAESVHHFRGRGLPRESAHETRLRNTLACLRIQRAFSRVTTIAPSTALRRVRSLPASPAPRRGRHANNSLLSRPSKRRVSQLIRITPLLQHFSPALRRRKYTPGAT
jgi:hypothetical protein